MKQCFPLFASGVRQTIAKTELVKLPLLQLSTIRPVVLIETKDSLAFYRKLPVLGRMACSECHIRFSLKITSDFSGDREGGEVQAPNSTVDQRRRCRWPNPEHLHFLFQLPSWSGRMQAQLEGGGQRWPSQEDTGLTKMYVAVGSVHPQVWG